MKKEAKRESWKKVRVAVEAWVQVKIRPKQTKNLVREFFHALLLPLQEFRNSDEVGVPAVSTLKLFHSALPRDAGLAHDSKRIFSAAP